MKIQFVSDLHLEFRSHNIRNILTPSAPILCMVGDICACGTDEDFNKLINFLSIFTVQFEHILHVAGNHEYYSSSDHRTSMNDIDKKLKKLNLKFTNYHFLQNQLWEYKKGKKSFVFIGSTLWTFVPPDLHASIQSKMNDYQYIYNEDKTSTNKNRKFKMQHIHKKHKSCVEFIKRAISAIKECKENKSIILLTHHKPIFDTVKINDFTFAYENDLQELLQPPIIVAAHGHTHQHYDKIINKVRVVSNPKGYIGEKTGYIPTFTVDV